MLLRWRALMSKHRHVLRHATQGFQLVSDCCCSLSALYLGSDGRCIKQAESARACTPCTFRRRNGCARRRRCVLNAQSGVCQCAATAAGAHPGQLCTSGAASAHSTAPNSGGTASRFPAVRRWLQGIHTPPPLGTRAAVCLRCERVLCCHARHSGRVHAARSHR
jgi:hypothetical protein